MTQSVKKIVYGGLLIAIGVILPQLFHIFGQSAGQTFLPMHIPVILAGMLIGPVWGLGVAVIVPILSSLITGMPPVPMLYFMLFELAAYAVVSGLQSCYYHFVRACGVWPFACGGGQPFLICTAVCQCDGLLYRIGCRIAGRSAAVHRDPAFDVCIEKRRTYPCQGEVRRSDACIGKS